MRYSSDGSSTSRHYYYTENRDSRVDTSSLELGGRVALALSKETGEYRDPFEYGPGWAEPITFDDGTVIHMRERRSLHQDHQRQPDRSRLRPGRELMDLRTLWLLMILTEFLVAGYLIWFGQWWLIPLPVYATGVLIHVRRKSPLL